MKHIITDMDIDKDSGRGNKTVIYISKELLKEGSQYYNISLPYMASLGGLKIAVEGIGPIFRKKLNSTVIAISYKIYIRIRMVGNMGISGTIEELAAMSGETAAGVKKTLAGHTRRAIATLQKTGQIDIAKKNRKGKKPIWIMKKSEKLIEAEKAFNKLTKEERKKAGEIETDTRQVLQLFPH